MQLSLRQIDLGAGILLVLASVIGVIVGVSLGIRFIPYVSVSLGIGSIIYLFYRIGDSWNYSLQHNVIRKVGDVSIFVGIFVLAALSRHSLGVPDVFYWVLAGVFLLLLLRILLTPSKISIVQILLFAVVLRGALWQSAPVIKHDPRLHVGISKVILDQGRLLTSPDYYYRDFPVAHVLTAATAMVTGLPIKEAYFLAIGVTATLGILAIFALTRHLISGCSLRPALLAAVFLATAAAHVSLTGFPITQTLTLIIHATALFAIVKPESIRLKAVVMGYIGVLSFVHNSAVISLTLLFGALLVCRTVAEVLQHHGGSSTSSTRPVSSLAIVLVGSIASAEYLHDVDYFHTQFRRLLAIFIYGPQNATTDISGASFGGAAYTLADPILHIGIGLFVTTIGLTFTALLAVRRLQQGDHSELTTIWTPAALGLFGFVGIGIFLAGTGRITRIRPEVLLLVAPVVGAGFDKLASRKVGVVAVCLILLATPALALVAAENSYRNPLTSPTNRAADDFTNHMSTAEVAALNFVERNAESLTSGSYITNTAVFQNVPDGTVEIGTRLPRNNITTSELTNCNSPILYRTSYHSYPGVDRPRKMDAVYDSGKASIIRCSDHSDSVASGS